MHRRLQLNLRLSPPNQYPRFGIHRQHQPELEGLGAGRSRGDLPVALEQQVAERDLGLVRDEEAAGARVLAVPEGQVVGARADEVRLVRGAVGAAAHAVEAVPVELGWVVVHGGVPHAVP